MKKYYIGIIVLFILTLGLTAFTLIQASAGKQDKETEKKAQSIATTLNRYISRNQKIPEKLEDAGIKDVPSTVRYTKLSKSEYKFCVTYKAAKSWTRGGPEAILFGAATKQLAEQAGETAESSGYKPSSLYLSYAHKKGENCQTVKPYLNGYDYFDDYDMPSSSSFSSVTAKARDTERITDTNNIHSKLEEYYNENNYYPSTITTQTFTGMDSESLKDPNGRLIVNNSSVGDEAAANAVDKQSSTYNYLYIPYGCKGTNKTECPGYVLKTWIEQPSQTTPNPFTKLGLNNT